LTPGNDCSFRERTRFFRFSRFLWEQEDRALFGRVCKRVRDPERPSMMPWLLKHEYVSNEFVVRSVQFSVAETLDFFVYAGCSGRRHGGRRRVGSFAV